jgi:hypothetical protein
MSVSSATTAGDLREAVRQRAWKNAEEFLTIYEESRFGKKEMGTEQKKRYEGLLKEIKQEK